jgi:hypothetical protein
MICVMSASPCVLASPVASAAGPVVAVARRAATALR